MSDLPTYERLKPETQPQTAVERSVSRDGAFSKPGTVGKGKGWAPAKGVRFRSATANQKPTGRRPGRRRKPDPRSVKFY